jgi:uncharacterized protein
MAPIAGAPLDRLHAVLAQYKALAVAVSGGVDSMTLAHVAQRAGGAPVTMFHACGPAVPAAARERVERHAREHGWNLQLIDAGEYGDDRYRANPLDRCYWCKTNLYARIREHTTDPIASGTNCDDLSDFRPGLRAADEHRVLHPYVDAGLAKSDIYALASELGLGDLERLPAQPCLASRVETGIRISADDLAFIDRVETMLARHLGADAVLRCRVTRRGIVIELAREDADATALARAVGERACAEHGRAFAGVRRYARGAAFLRPVR